MPYLRVRVPDIITSYGGHEIPKINVKWGVFGVFVKIVREGGMKLSKSCFWCLVDNGPICA